MSELLETLKTLDWPTIGMAVLTLASAIAAVTPTEKDNSVIERIKNLINRKK